MVKAGNTMWNDTVKANWTRDRRIAVVSGVMRGSPEWAEVQAGLSGRVIGSGSPLA